MVAYSFRPRFVPAIQAGLGTLPGIPKVHHGESIGPGKQSVVEYLPDPNPPHPKRQTIRAVGKRRHARVAEVLQLYTGMRTRQCKSIGVAKCIAVSGIILDFPLDVVRIVSDCRIEITNPRDLDAFAQKDGFADWKTMNEFWRAEHQGINVFTGVMIEWEPIR